MSDAQIKSAEAYAKRFGYDQVVIVSRKVGDDGLENVTTYGRTPEHCDVAAEIGHYLKFKVMGWPEEE